MTAAAAIHDYLESMTPNVARRSLPIPMPKINLTACRNCGGAGKRVIHGVEWPCFNCAGSGTVLHEAQR